MKEGLKMKKKLPKNSIRTIIAVTVMAILTSVLLSGCAKSKEKVLIYTSAEDYRVEYMAKRLKEELPEIDVTIEYMSTGNHAAKLLAEGNKTDCDITYDLEYGYMAQLDRKSVV